MGGHLRNDGSGAVPEDPRGVSAGPCEGRVEEATVHVPPAAQDESSRGAGEGDDQFVLFLGVEFRYCVAPQPGVQIPGDLPQYVVVSDHVDNSWKYTENGSEVPRTKPGMWTTCGLRRGTGVGNLRLQVRRGFLIITSLRVSGTMIASMTGYGRAEARAHGVTATVELRGVNSRFLEVSARLPRSLSRRENDVKEALRSRISRGKLTVTVNLERESDGDIPLSVNVQAARSYHKLLNELRKAVRSTEPVRLEHLLHSRRSSSRRRPRPRTSANGRSPGRRWMRPRTCCTTCGRRKGRSWPTISARG